MSGELIQHPKPGIYRNVEFGDYLAWDAISNSALHAAARSMAHYRCRQPVEETPAMRLGSLVHAGRFEPLSIASRYVVMPAYEHDVRTDSGDIPANPKATKAYKQLVAEFNRVNKDKIVVTQSQYDAMVAMVSSVATHKLAAALLEGGEYEVSVVWRDEDSGLLCKGRVDCWQHRQAVIVDLKTAADVGRFERQIADRAYHRQLAMYADGIASVIGDAQAGALVAVESAPPYCVRAAMMAGEAMDVGRTEYKRLLLAIAEAKESRQWPGYDSPERWTLPAWMRENEQVELVIGGQTVRL